MKIVIEIELVDAGGVDLGVDKMLDAGVVQDAVREWLDCRDGGADVGIVDAVGRVELADSEIEMMSCPSCVRKPDEKNHPAGMIFVGWGIGWKTCSSCGGTTRVPRDGSEVRR